MQRRSFLATAATVAASAGLAGCSALGGDGGDDGNGGGGDGPESPVYAGVNAMAAGDAEAFREAHHPDSEERPGEDFSWEGTAYTDASVEDAEVLEQGDGNATVRADISFTMEVTIDGETQTTSQNNTVEYEVREYEGEWRIWSTTTVDGSESGGAQ